MPFFSISKSTKQKILIGALIALGLFAFGFFFTTYFVPTPSKEGVGIDRQKEISEDAVRKIQKNVSAIEKELADPFYTSLKKYRWTADKTNPGKENPFIKNSK